MSEARNETTAPRRGTSPPHRGRVRDRTPWYRPAPARRRRQLPAPSRTRHPRENRGYGFPALMRLKYSRIARRSSAVSPRSSSQVGSRNFAAARPVAFGFVGLNSFPPFADVASRLFVSSRSSF